MYKILYHSESTESKDFSLLGITRSLKEVNFLLIAFPFYQYHSNIYWQGLTLLFHVFNDNKPSQLLIHLGSSGIVHAGENHNRGRERFVLDNKHILMVH
jgi:secreted Zn-dependent insulinase-like peptidase